MLVRRPLTTEVLTTLVELTKFENLVPRFSATVPPCWSEMQQEQQQRRHPQHLHCHGEATQHTRTWRLQQDRYYVRPIECTVRLKNFEMLKKVTNYIAISAHQTLLEECIINFPPNSVRGVYHKLSTRRHRCFLLSHQMAPRSALQQKLAGGVR